MSLEQTTKQETEIVELQISKIKTGLRIFVKSENMFDMANSYYEKFSDYITESLNTNHPKVLIQGNIINLSMLLMPQVNKGISLKIDNVFTQREIEKYVNLFERYIKLIKEAYMLKTSDNILFTTTSPPRIVNDTFIFDVVSDTI